MSALPAIRRTEPTGPLSDDEKARKAACMMVVNRTLADFIDCGNALWELKESRLYRDEFRTWDEFCQSSWQITGKHAYRLIQASEVARELPDDLPRPTAYSQVRPLIPIADAADRAGAWREASGGSGGEAPTGPAVSAAAAPLRKRVKPPADPVERARAEGVIPADAEVTVERPEMSPIGDIEEPEETDESWLESLPIRNQLSKECRRVFDIEALAYRSLNEARKTYFNASARVVSAARKEIRHASPWLSKHGLHFRIADPSDWLVCGDCSGQGVRPFGECPTCQANGYHTR